MRFQSCVYALYWGEVGHKGSGFTRRWALVAVEPTRQVCQEIQDRSTHGGAYRIVRYGLNRIVKAKGWRWLK